MPLPQGPLSAWLDVRNANQNAGLNELQQATAAQGLLARMQAQKEIEQIKPILAEAQGDPERAIKGLLSVGTPTSLKLASELKGLAPKPAEPFTLGPDQTRFDASGQPTARGVAKSVAPHMRTIFQGETSIQQELQPDGTWKEVGRGPRFSKNIALVIPEEAKIAGDALEQAAHRYRIDGTLPPNLGRGTQGVINTASILNRAAEISKEAGDSAESARIQQIAGKANSGALLQLEKQRNLVVAFKNTAARNADLVLEQSEKVDRLGSPALDRWILSGKKNIAGDPEVAKLDLAMRTFINEYARVTTTVTGGGITSDTARKEIEELIRSAHTKEQVREVVAFAKREMSNREASYSQQVEDIRKRLRPGSQTAPTAPTAPPSTGGVSAEDKALIDKWLNPPTTRP